MAVKTVLKTSYSPIAKKEVTIKTYPGLFGDFLKWVDDEGHPPAWATTTLYIKEEGLDEDQAKWLHGVIRRAVNDGMMHDAWWD